MPAGGAAPRAATLHVRAAGAPHGARSPRSPRWEGALGRQCTPQLGSASGQGAVTARRAPGPCREGQAPETGRPGVGG